MEELIKVIGDYGVTIGVLIYLLYRQRETDIYIRTILTETLNTILEKIERMNSNKEDEKNA